MGRRRKGQKRVQWNAVWGAAIVLLMGAGALLFFLRDRPKKWPLNHGQLQQALRSELEVGHFPAEVLVTRGSGAKEKQLQVELDYTLNSDLQLQIQKWLDQYNPDYAAVVVLDAKTGKVLAMNSHDAHKDLSGVQNMALRATFPAASIYKIVTAAAAMNVASLDPYSVIPFDGAAHTLYKRNLEQTRFNRWTRYVTLKEAFANSVNTVFGKLGVYHVGPEGLEKWTQSFGFNGVLQSELALQSSSARVPSSDEVFRLAEVASGFNRENTLSPLHGAWIAAVIANDGRSPWPHVVSAARDVDSGQVLWEPEALGLAPEVLPVNIAEGMRVLMQATVSQGTSRRSFRKIPRRGALEEVELGGKTGSLRGKDPDGKCDWFVGYGRRGEDRIALAVLSVNKERWKIKSSLLAGMILRKYFKQEIPDIEDH